MKNLLLIAVVGALAWYGISKYQSHRLSASESSNADTPVPLKDSLKGEETPSSPTFSCDGRTRCPQMHSCEEATYFLKNCPGVEMDGDGDGIPCESQWCGRG